MKKTQSANALPTYLDGYFIDHHETGNDNQDETSRDSASDSNTEPEDADRLLPQTDSADAASSAPISNPLHPRCGTLVLGHCNHFLFATPPHTVGRSAEARYLRGFHETILANNLDATCTTIGTDLLDLDMPVNMPLGRLISLAERQ